MCYVKCAQVPSNRANKAESAAVTGTLERTACWLEVPVQQLDRPNVLIGCVVEQSATSPQDEAKENYDGAHRPQTKQRLSDCNNRHVFFIASVAPNSWLCTEEQVIL